MRNNNNFNPYQILQLINGGGNPQQFMLNMLQQKMGNTPMGKNLIELAKDNNTTEIEAIARNIVGPSFDEQFNNFKKTLGL